MEWKVRILGESIILNELQRSFADGNLKIIKNEDEHYYLIDDLFKNCTTKKEVEKILEEDILLINGALRLNLSINEAIMPEEIVEIDDNGHKKVTVAFANGICIDTSVWHLKNKNEQGEIIQKLSPFDDIPHLIDMAKSDDAIKKVLRLYNRSLDWGGLYKIFEVVRDDVVNGERCITSKKWASQNQISTFRHTANSPSAIGDESRHGSGVNQPPAKPMTILEAKNFVESLINNWLKDK